MVTSHLSLPGTKWFLEPGAFQAKTAKVLDKWEQVGHPIRVQFLRKVYESVDFSHFLLNFDDELKFTMSLYPQSYLLKLIDH